MATLTATLPDGTVATKNTKVEYAFVIAAKAPDSDKWFAARWCRTFHAADKAINTIWPTYAKMVIPVN